MKLANHDRADIERLRDDAQRFATTLRNRRTHGDVVGFKSFLRRAVRLAQDPGLAESEKKRLAPATNVFALFSHDAVVAPETLAEVCEEVVRTAFELFRSYSFLGTECSDLSEWERRLIQVAYNQYKTSGQWPLITRVSATGSSLRSREFSNAEGSETDRDLAGRLLEFFQTRISAGIPSMTFEISAIASALSVSEETANRILALFEVGNAFGMISMTSWSAVFQDPRFPIQHVFP